MDVSQEQHLILGHIHAQARDGDPDQYLDVSYAVRTLPITVQAFLCALQDLRDGGLLETGETLLWARLSDAGRAHLGADVAEQQEAAAAADDGADAP